MAAFDDQNSYNLLPDDEDTGNLITFNDDRLDVFETILGITIGSDFIIEDCVRALNSSICTYVVPQGHHGNYLFDLLAFLALSDFEANEERPVVVILEWEHMEGAVHYVLWYGGTYIWDPYDEVQYPNADSWCQTCIAAKLIDLLYYDNFKLPWVQQDWQFLDPISRHIELRNLAVTIIKFSLSTRGLSEADNYPVIENAIEEAQSDPPVNYFDLASFLLELELPRFN